MNFFYLLLTINAVTKVVADPIKVNCALEYSRWDLKTTNFIMGQRPTEGQYLTSPTGFSVLAGGSVLLNIGSAASKGVIHANGGLIRCDTLYKATDCPKGNDLCYFWNGAPLYVFWDAPSQAGTYEIFLATSEGPQTFFGRQTITITVNATMAPTMAPTMALSASPITMAPSASTIIMAPSTSSTAKDPTMDDKPVMAPTMDYNSAVSLTSYFATVVLFRLFA